MSKAVEPDATDLSFIVFSDDWGGHPSSCQHLFKHISKIYPVVWVNTIGMRNLSFTWTDFSKAWQKIQRMLFGGTKVYHANEHIKQVAVCQPPMLPFSNFDFVRRLNTFIVTRSVCKALKKISMTNIIVVTTVPNACDFVGNFGEKIIVYYCVDDFAEWPKVERDLVRRMEEELISKSHLFVATSDKLFRKLALHQRPTYLLTHGVDLSLFSAEVASEHECLIDIKPPRIGYFGLFDERSDQRLIAKLACRLPDFSFVITGPVVVNISVLEKLPNVFFTGSIGYLDLPTLAKGLDVLLLPYVCNELTESISPLKIKEYLATGKPVVSTPLSEVKKFSDYVCIGSSVAELEVAIRRCVSSSNTDCREKVRASLAHEDWQEKACQFIDICNRDLRRS